MAPIFVPKGGLVSWNLWALHRRKDYFGEDAEEFRPERWLDGEDEEGGEGMGMGEGKGKKGKKKGLRPGWEYLRKLFFSSHFFSHFLFFPFSNSTPSSSKKGGFNYQSNPLSPSLLINPIQPSTAEPESASVNNSLSQKQVMSLYEFVKNFPVCYTLFIIKNININIIINININIMMVRRIRRKRRRRIRRNLGGNF